MKNLSADEIQDILWDDDDDYETVVPETLLDKGRWWVSYEQIVKCKSDGTYWSITWREAATECQDEPFEPSVTEVIPVQVTRTEYVVKE